MGEIECFAPDDWRARTRFRRARLRTAPVRGARGVPASGFSRGAIETEEPDVLLVDEGAWGAAVAAERSGLPWAYSMVSPVPLPSRDSPPFGLGLTPRRDARGRARDWIVRRVALGGLERMIASHVNPIRVEQGLPEVGTLEQIFLAASCVLAYTAEPFEYPRSDWPTKVHLVGPGLWEPPAAAPEWLDELEPPLVLVTCSSLFQNDRRLAEVAAEAFGGARFDVVITTADVRSSGLRRAGNIRVERFVPHSPVLARAACVVCHAGMGITQKALAHGVPVVAVPFGRDQPEVARRVEVAGAGVRLPVSQLRPDLLLRAVDRALELTPGARRIAAAFAAAGGPTLAADTMELLVRTPRREARRAGRAPDSLRSP